MTNEEIKNAVKNDLDGFAGWLGENGWYRSPKKAGRWENDAWPCGVPLLMVAQMWLDGRA